MDVVVAVAVVVVVVVAVGFLCRIQYYYVGEKYRIARCHSRSERLFYGCSYCVLRMHHLSAMTVGSGCRLFTGS